MPEFSLTLMEVLALGGLVQCVFVIVYILLRAGFLSLALPPLLFFFVLGAALYMDLATRTFQDDIPNFSIVRFWLWVTVIPASVLFIFQFSRLIEPVAVKYYLMFLLVAGGSVLSTATGGVLATEDACPLRECPLDAGPVIIWGLVTGTLCLSTLLLRQTILSHVPKEPAGRERYWMIVALLGMNIVLLLLMCLTASGQIYLSYFELARTVIGISFVYISSTSLFRIYPPPIRVIIEGDKASLLNPAEEQHIEQIKRLLDFEKVYLEPSYSRSDLAQELKLPESAVSKLINTHFGKALPVLLNEYRVKEAQQLLQQTDAPVKTIAEEIGFNSLASFNRVFKEMTGETATDYRHRTKKP